MYTTRKYIQLCEVVFLKEREMDSKNEGKIISNFSKDQGP